MNHSADLLKELKIDRGAPPPREPRRGLFIGLGVAALVLAIVVAGLVIARDDAPLVQTARVVAIGGNGGASASVLDATGYVVARRMATVSAKITGKVIDVLIEEGQRVEEGQVMARLEAIDAKAQRDLATAQLSAARSRVAGAQAQYDEAAANAARLGELVGQQLVSQAQYEQAIASRDALRAQLATARREVEVAGDQLAIAENGVDNTVVRAPFDGVVTAKAAQPGEIVSPISGGGGFTRTGIGTVVDMDSLEVEVDVGESYINRVEPGMPVEATLNAYPDWQIPGHVIAIIPTADRGKATVKVRIALEEQDERIVPEMGVRVSFLEKAAPAAEEASEPGVLVPAAAIVSRDGQDVAFVLSEPGTEESAVDLRQVEVGRTLGDDREVTSGLAGGQAVVVDPPEGLEDGAQVRIAKEQDEEDA